MPRVRHVVLAECDKYFFPCRAKNVVVLPAVRGFGGTNPSYIIELYF